MRRMIADYCSRCGKRIEGVCFACYDAMREDLARRQAIPPGCPKLAGEFGATAAYIDESRAERARRFKKDALDK